MAQCAELASHALAVADIATGGTITTRAAMLGAVSAPLLDPVAAWRAVASNRKRSVRVLELCDELSGLLTQEGMWVTLYKTGAVARESVTPATVSVWDALTRPVGAGAVTHDAHDERGNSVQQDFWVDSSSDDEDGGERPAARLREGIRTVLAGAASDTSPLSNEEEHVDATGQSKSVSGWRAARALAKPLVHLKHVRALGACCWHPPWSPLL